VINEINKKTIIQVIPSIGAHQHQKPSRKYHKPLIKQHITMKYFNLSFVNKKAQA